VTRRTVPSAGSRHPFETLLLVNNVDRLQPGLYRFIASQHRLLPLRIDAELAPMVVQASHNQAHLRTCAALFIWVAVPARTVYRYSQRAYRYIHLDAGHVCQNLCLA
jgi:SagB-type dehydrogenase family enzyme